ncbi:MAG: hypothetical protein ACRD5R_09180 [Candidatus Acidiferrales bacterium]
MSKSWILAVLFLAIATVVAAKDARSYERGVLLSMDSSSCGMMEKGSKTLAGEVLGTDGQHKSTQEVLCQEYVLQGDRLVYHIRPMDMKHPMLLPVGDTIQYRIHKDKMYVLDREGDTKERKYSVISIEVRADVKDAKNVQ